MCCKKIIRPAYEIFDYISQASAPAPPGEWRTFNFWRTFGYWLWDTSIQIIESSRHDKTTKQNK